VQGNSSFGVVVIIFFSKETQERLKKVQLSIIGPPHKIDDTNSRIDQHQHDTAACFAFHSCCMISPSLKSAAMEAQVPVSAIPATKTAALLDSAAAAAD
jgi:hypothetical protein